MDLDTDRLRLRDFVFADWPAVLDYQQDARYLHYYPHETRTPADAQAFVQMFLDQQAARPRLQFQPAIVLRDGRLIGNCGLRLDSPHTHEASIGFEIAPRHWGQGYATEAAQAMLRMGFEDFGLYRVWAMCISENLASARVLEKLGLRAEGRLRAKEHFKGRWWDVSLYAILAPEWSGLRR